VVRGAVLNHLVPLPCVPRRALALLAFLALCARAATAQAQTPAPEGAATARIHLGGLALEPRVALRNVGIDTNVFNEASGETRDWTASFGPALDSWLQVGRTLLASTTAVGWNYYREAVSERSFDASHFSRLDVNLGPLTPHVNAGIERTRQRPNVEIDARALRHTTRAGGGLVGRIGPKLSVDLFQEHRRIEFENQVYDGVNLATLSRREVETTLHTSYALTPLTSVAVRAAVRQDRFLTETLRDADTLSVMPGITFKPLALVSGSAFVGFRAFTPLSEGVPAFRGLVSDVDLRYQLRDLTRLAVTVIRDVDYSYEPTEPYYVSSGVSGSITQAIGGGWDLVGRGATTRLDYRAFAGTVAADAARVDRVNVYGIGMGRHLASDVRIGLDVNHVTRHSPEPSRVYTGLRVGGSVTYGFQ
jgi:hypothetical protein